MAEKWQYVSSRSNPIVVNISKLKDKKYRREQGLFRLDGIKLFSEAVSRRAPVKYVFVRESARDRLCPAVEESGTNAALYVLADPAFERITEENAPEGIVTVCAELPNISELDAREAANRTGNTALVLESVRDAGNIGTVIRTADAFGIDTLIFSTDCADLYNPKTVRGAMGALFTQNIIVTPSISELVKELQNLGTYTCAAALHKDAVLLGSTDLPERTAIFVGNEGHGLSGETIDACDTCLLIPMSEGAESLNAAVAAAVCMWELGGRRKH